MTLSLPPGQHSSPKTGSILKGKNLLLRITGCIAQSVLAIIFSNTFTHNQAEQIKKE